MRSRHLFIIYLAGAIVTGCGGDRSENRASENRGTAVVANQPVSVADALAASPDHRLFVQALQSAGIFGALRGPVPYTIFAPTDVAFAALPAETRRRLADPEQGDRRLAMLSVHIVSGRVTRADIERLIDQGQSGRADLATVTGDRLSLARDGPSIVAGLGGSTSARLTGSSQIQSNGIIHPIDAALIPGS